MKHTLLVALTATMLIYNCKKDNLNCVPDLPCATKYGANTFGCYINGKPWVADIAPYMLDPTLHAIEAEYDVTGYLDDPNNALRVTASRWDSTSSGFLTLYIKPVKGVGELNAGTADFSVWGNLINQIHPNDVMGIDLDTIQDYSLTITHLDTEAKVISGVFSFKGISGAETIEVTDGRFDVKYLPN
ncbi:MAG TPA: hypothetical protein VK168_09645 [Saprospiraceae bacterium]|nr:hypothetical protein [Saprospiraceae bacterium]